jgi:hypothetical protein
VAGGGLWIVAIRGFDRGGDLDAATTGNAWTGRHFMYVSRRTEMTNTSTRQITPVRDGDELAHQPRLALLTLGLGLLAFMALFSSTWFGLGLGVLAVCAGAAAWPQARRRQVSLSPLVAGLVFGVLAIALVWIGSGIHKVIWG